MEILKKMEFDGVCKKYAAAIILCAAILGACGAARGSTLFGVPSAVFGNIAACAALTLYAGMFVYASGKALLKTAEDYSGFVRESGRIFAAVCISAQAAKLFLLTLPCSGEELVSRIVLIADALTWWIIPIKMLEKNRAEFIAKERRKELLSRSDLLGVCSGSCDIRR